MEYLFYTQFFSSLFLCGLCWFVQLLHYPLLSKVGADSFAEYHRLHLKKAGLLIAPVMLIELITAVSLLLLHLEDAGDMPFLTINVLSVATIWLSTFLVQVPLHRKLGSQSTQEERDQTITKLVSSNWLRTGLWTARILLFFSIL